MKRRIVGVGGMIGIMMGLKGKGETYGGNVGIEGAVGKGGLTFVGRGRGRKRGAIQPFYIYSVFKSRTLGS